MLISPHTWLLEREDNFQLDSYINAYIT